jgi:hypothetical protein
MMKKIVTIMAAALLTLGAAANAMAYFANGDLIRVAYVRGGINEVATDLGSASNIVSGTTVTLNGTNGLTLSALGATSWDQVYVAYFALDTNTKKIWESADASTTTNKNAYTALGSAMSNLYQGYGSVGGATNQTVTLAMSDPHSYSTLFNNNDATGVSDGYMANYNTSWAGVESNLAALATGGTATATIYTKVANTTAALAVTPLTVTTNPDGSAIATTSTPIPPSFLLLGSGLLGMVGIRRKFTA